MAERRSADITNNAGGVMTDEVGVITGDLTLVTELIAAPPPPATTPPATSPPASSPPATSPGAAPPVTGRLTPTTTPFLHPGAPAGAAPMSAAAAGQPQTQTFAGAGRAGQVNGGAPATAVLRVQYKGAAEWYTVTNGTCQLPNPAALDAVHQLAVGLLNRPEG